MQTAKRNSGEIQYPGYCRGNGQKDAKRDRRVNNINRVLAEVENKFVMSTSALFDEDSSDDEEFDPSKKEESKDDTPKRTIEADEESSSDEEPRPNEVAKEEAKKPNGNDLFGDDSDDSEDAMEADKTKEDDSPKRAKPSASDLFGDDSDDDDDEGEAKLDDVVGSSAPASATVTKKETIENQDDDAQVEARAASALVQKPPEKATVLESTRPGDDVTLHITKLPNLVAIQPVAFEEDLYLEKEEEEQYKGYVHNMIRWRYKRDKVGNLERDEDGQLVRESNSRIVRWSDGSFTLHIGNEAFDVQTTDSSVGGFAGLNGFIYLSQKATFSNEGNEDETPGGTVLECMAPVSSRFVPKPSSLQSESHKSLTVAVRQKTIKKARIAEYVTSEDPEKAKAARIRNNEDLEKATARKSSSYRAGGGSRYRRPAMSRGYLEEEEDGDYDTTNIRALKKRNMDDDMDDYGDDSDGDDDGFNDTFNSRKRSRSQDDSEEEELVFDEESDEEEGTLIKGHASSKRKPQAVVDDDDDED